MSALKPSPTEQSYGELLKAYDVFNEQLFDGQLPGALVTLTRKKRTCGYYSAGRFGSSDGRRARCDEIAMNPQFFGTQPIEEVMATLVHEMAHQWQFHFGKDQPRGRYHNNEWATKMEAIGLVPSDTGRPGGRRTGDQMSDYIDPRGGKFQDACAMLVTQDFRLTWYDRYVDEAHRPPASISEGSSSSNLAFLTTRFVVGSDVEDDEPSLIEEGGNDDNASMLAALLGCPPPGALDFADVKHVAGEVPNSNRVKYSCSCGNNVWGRPALKITCEECSSSFAPAVGVGRDLVDVDEKRLAPRRARRRRGKSVRECALAGES